MSGTDPSCFADDVRYTVIQPEGYFTSAAGDTLPWFDTAGRAIVLLCHEDGSVTWELRGRNGEVLEPAHHDGDGS